MLRLSEPASSKDSNIGNNLSLKSLFSISFLCSSIPRRSNWGSQSSPSNNRREVKRGTEQQRLFALPFPCHTARIQDPPSKVYQHRAMRRGIEIEWQHTISDATIPGIIEKKKESRVLWEKG